MRLARQLLVFLLLCTPGFLLIGCGEKRQAKAKIPPPPSVEQAVVLGTDKAREEPGAPLHPGINPDLYAHAKPIYTEVGLASWYGPPYHNHRAANGEIFDMYQLTAAHKTLPLNSICRITNIATGQSTLVRINDRGPFVGTRIVDLSMGAAKEIGVWRPGVAKVRLDVLEAPADISTGGRWAVQIGAFKNPGAASALKGKLARKYQTATVQQFAGPTGEWVRVRVLNDDKNRAEQLAHETHTGDAEIFVVRLD